MSLLDDARQLAEALSGEPGTYDDELCPARCKVGYVVRRNGEGMSYPDYSHAPECPFLAMPKVVKALEAADRALPYLKNQNCPDAGCRRFADIDSPHTNNCDIEPLILALESE